MIVSNWNFFCRSGKKDDRVDSRIRVGISGKGEGDPLLSNSGGRRCCLCPSTLCTWINSINPFHPIKRSRSGWLLVWWRRRRRAQRGGNSNNPEVFSRSPPGQRGSQDTAKTVRVLCSIHPIAHTPFSPFLSLSLSLSLSFSLSPSIFPSDTLFPLCSLLHPFAHSPHSRMYRGVFSYELASRPGSKCGCS